MLNFKIIFDKLWVMKNERLPLELIVNNSKRFEKQERERKEKLKTRSIRFVLEGHLKESNQVDKYYHFEPGTIAWRNAHSGNPLDMAIILLMQVKCGLTPFSTVENFIGKPMDLYPEEAG